MLINSQIRYNKKYNNTYLRRNDFDYNSFED